jgi:copper homeostasis protein
LGEIKSIKPYQVEACVVSFAQAIQAQQSGADRIEICSRLETGGMTPDEQLVSALCAQLSIPVRVMIRNTEDGYEADESILEKMLHSIDVYKKIPVDGFVIGVLKDHRIDRDAMKRIIERALPIPITFHKALDESCNIPDDIVWLKRFPVIDTILTSGGGNTAFDGAEKILQMKSIFNGTIMAGGKILPEQLDVLHERLDLKWYHGRGIVGDLGKGD